MHRQTKAAIVVHGGAGAGRSLDDGCARAAEAGRQSLAGGNDALAAAIAAVVVMEEDERFNAGTGASLGLDGVTIEMDASVMDSRGVLGAVAGLRAVRNPVLVARQVADTPHCLLSGEGALNFARLMGHQPYDKVASKAREQHREMLKKLSSDKPAMPGEDNNDFARYWNYAGTPPFSRGGENGSGASCRDTVGAVVRDLDGHFAVAASTGGSAPSLLGRVGDTPIIGSGFYAGRAGAVAATGVGEHIIRTVMAITAYRWIEEGMDLHAALQRAVDMIPKEVDVGLIAVSATQAGVCSNAEMPQAIYQQ